GRGGALPDRSEPSTGSATDLCGERSRSGQQCGEGREAVRVGGDLEFEIVDLAGHATVAVEELMVEQCESGPELTTGRRIHARAFVAIMSGIVAIATMVSSTM